ncbi:MULTISPECIES: DUF3054 domain-containing protein [Cryobacterium]|uniref:DUF3054 domain-containing protein n=1 Tax=Cryobacterium levicorallinum TaxID=995038 RepID=A0A1I3ARY4_9MICO|nr:MULTISPECIES: DUF3054 domain-containing protein [Cryobacterium]TFB88013.1 DUF3054 domain-containing protein [Cryobacterium levicorallinum]TFD55708.1 DUF3054 domain-containing protein [Cryobacterium sp. Hh38]GEP26794.1 hypothetical protein CLE01_13920 [Cryobacterium levicorallinum]SFH52772.1 Protein of unknown function [Cryobacterium levicorallinum]
MSRQSIVTAGVLDAALVLLFAAIGRLSHGETLAGLGVTAWPFLGGLIIGWLLLRAWRHPLSVVWTGLGIWIATVAGGLLLRLAGGQGVQLSFAIVTTIVLGIFLLGWRAIAALVRRTSRKRMPAPV